MIEALAVAAFAMAAGLFGLAGVIMFWLTAFAVAFLFAMAIWATETLAALIARRFA